MVILFVFIITVSVYVYIKLTKFNLERLNFVHRHFVFTGLEKWEKYIEGIPKTDYPILDYQTLLNLLNPVERFFIKQILTIEPKNLGFKGPFYSIEPAKNLSLIESRQFTGKGEGRETGIQYCSDDSYQDFIKMNESLKNDLGRSVYIDSGYRSPGRQAFLFINYLVTENDFNLKENGKWIALPGYSEHGMPVNNAIDIATEEGINGFSENQTAEDFENTEEYNWLIKNASNFNYYLSYSKNNSLGVAYEPWHWHWEKKKPV